MSYTNRKSWEQYHRRMLEETARYIEWGLKHPEQVIEIPLKPEGEGGFPPGVGGWFWSTVLTDRTTSTIRKWRDLLLRRPKQLPGLLRRRGR